MNFFNTFRGRLLIILAFLLIATLGVQLYVNLTNRRENIRLRELQDQALTAGFVLGTNGITSGEYMKDLIGREGQTFFDEQMRQRIEDILLVNQDWQITDSLNKDYLPTSDENDKIKYLNLNEIKNLPPLVRGNRLGSDLQKFPNANTPESEAAAGEMHAVPIQTSEGRWYVLVTLKTDKGEIFQKATQPLIYTLLILLFSTAITFFLVWRFTRPIANLSGAARRVAEGDLSFRLADATRTDEIGQLAAQFNLMTAELEKSRDLETQLQQAEKSAVVGRLASAIAHEIRNPLNYINLTLDHLRAKFAPEDAAKQADFEKLTAQLKTEVGRINHQITDFLRYSRPTKLNLQPLDARKVVEDSMRIVEPQAADQNIKISLIERENVPPIFGDAEVLRSVFSNLFINAVQAMEKNGGELNVIISPAEESVKIEITDTGDGIPAENLDKIFEPYFSTKETGTGLGLAIVKKIVDDHIGTIAVESKLNEGTKFTLKLPGKEN
ncbi:MAG: HAMP domain-containing protein [Pyrinomonadaceae bacterium]|nr:HAMP domain-containing protein [Pyrinomonadaceae bacterium]